MSLDLAHKDQIDHVLVIKAHTYSGDRAYHNLRITALLDKNFTYMSGDLRHSVVIVLSNKAIC